MVETGMQEVAGEGVGDLKGSGVGKNYLIAHEVERM